MRLFQGSIDDIPRMIPCAIEYTNKINDMPFNAAHWVDCWQSFISSNAGAIFLDESDSGEIVGGIGVIKYPCMLTGRMTSVELFWFTSENNRNNGVKLYQMAEQWAIDTGCARMAMIYLPESMPEKLDIFYRRKGFKLRECHYEKELKP